MAGTVLHQDLLSRMQKRQNGKKSKTVQWKDMSDASHASMLKRVVGVRRSSGRIASQQKASKHEEAAIEGERGHTMPSTPNDLDRAILYRKTDTMNFLEARQGLGSLPNSSVSMMGHASESPLEILAQSALSEMSKYDEDWRNETTIGGWDEREKNLQEIAERRAFLSEETVMSLDAFVA